MNSIKSSVDLDSLISILATSNQLQQKYQNIIEPQLPSEEQIDLGCTFLKLKNQLDCNITKVDKLKNLMEQESRETYSIRERIKLKREKLNQKMKMLKECEIQLESQIEEVNQTRIIAEEHERLIKKCLSKIARDLSIIYNIERDSRDLTLFHIRGIPLNNNIYQDVSHSICDKIYPLCSFNTIDPELIKISIALGYSTHLIMMLSCYLSVSLRYPIVFCGSKSYIIDIINVDLNNEERRFPLFLDNKNQTEFDYGLFLLNKNVEQLLQSQGLTALDLRNTLPNLKWLLQTLQSVKPL